MKTGIRRSAMLAALASLVAIAGSVFVAAQAQAYPAESGSMRLSGDPGEYVSGGRSYTYSTANGDQFDAAVRFAYHQLPTLTVSASSAGGVPWSVMFSPGYMQPMPTGTYVIPLVGTGLEPLMSLTAGDRNCSRGSGSFNLRRLVWEARGYVQGLDATFEYHCNGDQPALRGEIHIDNPPAPPMMELGVTITSAGLTRHPNGDILVRGTATCTKPTSVQVMARVVQQRKPTEVSGYGSSHPAACTPGTVVAWQATVSAENAKRFRHGAADVSAHVMGVDPYYGQMVYKDAPTLHQTLKKVTPSRSH